MNRTVSYATSVDHWLLLLKLPPRGLMLEPVVLPIYWVHLGQDKGPTIATNRYARLSNSHSTRSKNLSLSLFTFQLILSLLSTRDLLSPLIGR